MTSDADFDFRHELASLVVPPWHKPTGIADLTLDSAIRRHIVLVLGYTGGDMGWACDELGINGTTLWRWRRRWNAPLRVKVVR